VSNAAFLLGAIAAIVIGSLVVWAVNRKPKTFMSSIDDFEREMRALGRDPSAMPGARRRKRTVQPPDGARDDKGRPTGASGPTEERRP
jgi:hypothetical protein